MEEVIRKAEIVKLLQQLCIQPNQEWWDAVTKQGTIREHNFTQEQID